MSEPQPLARSLTVLVAALAVLAGLMATPASADTSVRRLAGPDRIATAVAVASAGWSSSGTVLLARADEPADALAGAALAGSLGAPLLLTDSGRLAPAVEQELARLRASTVILLGGPVALAPAVEHSLRSAGLRVERIAGPTRFDTAAAIARRVAPAGAGSAFVVADWRGALAVSGVAASRARAGKPTPILLSSDGLAEPTLRALRDLRVRDVVIADVGGAVAAAVDTQLDGHGFGVRRLSASTPYRLSSLAAQLDPLPGTGRVLIATGDRFPDGMAAGALAARDGAVLLLVPTGPASSLPWSGPVMASIAQLTVIGGEAAVPATMVQTARQSLSTSTATSPSEPGVVIRPTDDARAIVAGNPAGTTYQLAAGIHYRFRVTPKSGDRFVGQPGTVLSGAKVLTGFTRDAGGRWVVTGQTQRAERIGVWGSGGWTNQQYAVPGSEQEVHAGEEVFVDGRRLRHVNRLSQVDRPGTWFYDEDRDRIVLFDDPRGRLVETSVEDRAFLARGTRDVTIEHVEVRHYATRVQRGPIDAENTRDWTIRRVHVRDNHAVGIHAGPGTHISNCKVTGNGQAGITAHGEKVEGAPIVIENCEVAGNHALGYDPDFEAGGMKIKHTRGAIVRNNWVHHNRDSRGIWFDVDNVGATVVGNLVEHNDKDGIFYEISYAARITNNLVRHNSRAAGRYTQAGIHVVDSADVEVARNVVYDNGAEIVASHQNRTSYASGPTGVRNLNVHDNDVTGGEKSVGIMRNSSATTDPFVAAANNRFDANTYRGGRTSYLWVTHGVGADVWKRAGHDARGTWVAGGPPSPMPAIVTFTRSAYGV